MNLRNRKGDEFRLEIVRYELPEINDKYWDSNWLRIRLSGRSSLNSWSIEDPCLLTFEIESLAKWLENLISDKISLPHNSFTEPSPQFRVIKHNTGNFLFRVDLGYIFRKKMPEVFGDKKTIYIYFPFREIDFSYQAHLLREQLKNYPQRVFR